MRVLILPPTRRDGEITSSLLSAVGVESAVCAHPHELVREIRRGAGAVLLTEQILTTRGIQEIVKTLGQQEAWSDLPIVMLLHGGAPSASTNSLLLKLRNVVLLERPAPTRTVVSAVQAALRARQRQYQIRGQIEALQQSEAALRETQERFQAMANSIPQLAWMAQGPMERPVWYNQRWH